MKRTNRSSPRRGPARWTPIEALLIVVSVVMIVFPLLAEGTRWIAPPSAPAAPRGDEGPQRATSTLLPGQPTDTPISGATNTPIPGASNTPVPAASDTPIPGASNTPVPPTNTTVAGATNTPEPPTNTPGLPTNTPDLLITDTPSVPTNTPDTGVTVTPLPATTTPNTTATNTPVPPTDTSIPGATNTPTVAATGGPATNTPDPGNKKLTVSLTANVSSVRPGQEFVYTIVAVTTGTTAEAVRVDDTVDAKLEVLSAQASNGSCTIGSTVSCTVNATKNGVQIALRVRVRADATPGAQVANEAIGAITGGSNNGFTDVSDRVFVNIAGTPVTSTPTSPSSTSNPQPTSSNATSVPATSQPQPTSGSGGGGGGNDDNDDDAATPTNPPLPPLPPDAQPADLPTAGPAVRPTARPAVRPTARPQRTQTPAQATTQAENAAATATQVAVTTTPTSAIPTPDSGLYFRMASDWGSAYPDQTVNYVIAVRNVRAKGSPNYANLQVTSELPANLQVVSARADRGGDPTVAGNKITLKLAALAPGESLEIVVETKVRSGVSAGTSIASQASLAADGLPLQAYSNVVSLLVVGAPPQQATATASLVATTAASPTAAPSATTAAGTTPSATIAVSQTPTKQPVATQVAGGGSTGSSNLPNTSTGVPLLGFALMGMTLAVRTVRIHRAKSRV